MKDNRTTPPEDGCFFSDSDLTVAEQIHLCTNLIQNCAVAIFAIDMHHLVIHWNKACEELTGIPASDMLGSSNHWKPFYRHKRRCLSDIVIDHERSANETYSVYGPSVLIPGGLHAEGWYADLGGHDRYIIYDAAPLLDNTGRILGAVESLQDITTLKRMEEERTRLYTELKEATNKIKTLKGLIPICAACKKIRDDTGYWNQLESYLELHSEAEFSHGLCPECKRRLFPPDSTNDPD